MRRQSRRPITRTVRERIAILTALFMGVPALVEPCDCVVVQLKPWNAFANATHVYLGSVVRVERPDQYSERYSIKPLRVWKGPLREYTVSSSRGGCSLTVMRGEYYLLYAMENPQDLTLCGVRTVPLCPALKDIAWLDRNRGLPPTVVPGVDCSLQERK
jgi:hypothetical protein